MTKLSRMLEELTEQQQRDAFAKLIRDSRRKSDAAKVLATAGKPRRFKSERGLSHLVSPELRADAPKGTWRVTTFDKSGPVGHMEFNTAHDAFKHATMHNWQIQESRRTRARKIIEMSTFEIEDA